MRLRVRARTVFLVSGALLVVVLGVLMGVASSPRFARWQKDRLEERLSRTLQRDVTIERLEFYPLVTGFEARGLTARRPGDADGPPLFRVEAVVGRLSLRSLFFGALVFDYIVVDSPEIHLSRRDGEWNWPKTERRGGRARLRARRVDVRQGLLSIEDHDMPFDFEMKGARIEASGSGGGTLDGIFEADELVFESPKLGRHDLDVSASVRYEAGLLSFRRFRAEAGGVAINGHGEVELSGDAVMTARFGGAVDLENIPVGGETGLAGGTVHADGTLRVWKGDWEAEGTIRSDAVSWKQWTVEGVEGPFRALRSEGLTIGPATGSASGGRVEATVTWPLALQDEGRAEFTATSCALQRLLETLGRPLPLAAGVDARGSLTWRKGETGEPDGRITATLRPTPGTARNGWPAAGEATILLKSGTVHSESAEIRAGDSTTVLRGWLDPRERTAELEFAFTSDDLASSAPFVEDLARSIRLETDRMALESLGGRGVVAGRIAFDGRQATGEGTFLGEAFEYRGGGWGTVDGAFDLGTDEVVLSDVRARRDESRASIEVRFPRGGGGFLLEGGTEDWEASDLLRVAGLPPDLEGPVSGRTTIRSVESDLEVSLSASIGSGSIREIPIDGGAVEAVLANGRLALAPAVVRLADGEVRIEGDVAVGAGDEASEGGRSAEESTAADVTWSGLDVGRVIALAGARPPVSVDGPTDGPTDGAATGTEPGFAERLAAGGVASGRGRLRHEGGANVFEGSVEVPELSVAGFVLGAFDGGFQTDFATIRWDARLPLISLVAEGEAGLESPWPLTARVALSDAGIADLAGLSERARAWDAAGTLSGTLDVSGPLAMPERLSVEGMLSSLEMFVGAARFELEQPAGISYEGGAIRLAGARLVGEGSRLEIAGRVVPGPQPTVDARGSGTMDLAVLQAFLPDTSIRGIVVVSLSASGALTAPVLSGELSMSGGRLRGFDFPLLVEQVALEASIENNVLQASRISANVGGGRVSGAGRIELAGFSPRRASARLQAESVTLSAPEGFRGTYSGSLEIDASPERATISGNLNLVRGVYRKDFELDAVSFGERTRAFAQDLEAHEQYREAVQLNIHLSAPDQLWLRNDFGEMEGMAEIDVKGTLARPEVTGRVVAIEGGRIRFRRVDYRVREASVEFAPELSETYVNMKAETRISGYEVLLHVFGPLRELDYNLTSSPSLLPDQIVSLLVTGSPTAMTGESGQTTGDLARSYLGGTVTGFIEEPLESLFRLDRVRIDPLLLAGETDPTTVLTLGKRLTPDLLLLYSRDLGGQVDPIYALEYEINRNLLAFGEGGGEGGAGADLRYTTSFRLGGPRPENDGPSAGLLPGARTVADVSIEGADGILDHDATRKLPVKEGDRHTGRKIREGLRAVRSLLVDAGYLQASVRSHVAIRGDTVSVSYQVDPGAPVEIRIEAKGRSTRAVRRRLRRLWQEALFTEELLEDARREIVRYYRSEGYYTVLVDYRTEDRRGGKTLVVYTVDTGDPVAIEKVVIEGNDQVDGDAIRDQMLSAPSSLFTRRLLKPEVLEEDVRAIRSLYLDRGYLDARVEPEITLGTEGRRATLTLRVTEGKQYLVDDIRFAGEGAIEAETLRARSGLAEGEPFSPRDASEGAEQIRRFLDEEGFPDADVRGSIERDEGGVDVLFDIETGTRQTVRRITIEGNHRTREKVIRQELGMSSGDVFSNRKAQEAQKRLYRLGVFDSVTVEAGPEETGKIGRVVTVRVSEAKNLSLAVGAGYDSEDGARGTFEIADANFTGRGRYVAFQARVAQRQTRAQTVVKIPGLFGWNLDSIVSTFWENVERESFEVTRVGSSFQIRREFNPRLTGLFRYNFNISKTDPEIPQSLLREVDRRLEAGRVRLASAEYAIIRDTRNSPFTPRSGTLLSADARLFAPAFGSNETFAKLFLQGTYQHPVTDDIVVAGSLRVGLARPFGSTTSVPLVERYFAGGDTTVRGYRRDSLGTRGPDGTVIAGEPVGGQALLIGNLEVRFPIKGPFGGVVFYDAGNVYREISDLGDPDIRHSAGGGFRLNTPIGPVRLEYGHKLDYRFRDRLEGADRGRVFFSIGTSF